MLFIQLMWSVGMSHRGGFTERPLDIPPLHIASVTSDFDADGLPEIVGSPLNLKAGTDTELQTAILAIYERFRQVDMNWHTLLTVWRDSLIWKSSSHGR